MAKSPIHTLNEVRQQFKTPKLRFEHNEEDETFVVFHTLSNKAAYAMIISSWRFIPLKEIPHNTSLSVTLPDTEPQEAVLHATHDLIQRVLGLENFASKLDIPGFNGVTYTIKNEKQSSIPFRHSPFEPQRSKHNR